MWSVWEEIETLDGFERVFSCELGNVASLSHWVT